MAKYLVGDVVLVYFPYQDDPKTTKLRPCVIIEDLQDEGVVVKCTKTDKSSRTPCILISKGTPEHKEMHLTDDTYISVKEELQLKKSYIHSYKGNCPESIMEKIFELRGE